MDNLNTHCLGAHYEAFQAQEAKRIADRLEIHYIPKRASGLNIAEIELSVLTRQCFKRRIVDRQMLKREVEA